MKARAIGIALALLLSGPAVAADRDGGHQREQRVEKPRGGGHHGNWKRHDRPDYNPVPGILGGILGGWLAGQSGEREEEEGEAPEPDEEEGLKPFTPDWYDFCADKYRSFDPKTGYYTSSLDGVKRFCRTE